MSFLKSRFAIVVAVVLAVVLLYHLATLSFTPIVWSDEVCYNSITLDWIQNGTYFFQADKHWGQNREALVYGWVFFALNGAVISILGNGVFAGRLLVLLAGMAVYVWFAFTLKRRVRITDWLAWLGLALLITDPFFTGALHKARMDTLALLFYMTSAGVIWSFFSEPERRHKTGWWLLSGSLYGLALITASRLIWLAPPLALLIIWIVWEEKFRKPVLGHVLLWGLGCIAFVVTWLYVAFHTVPEMVEYVRWVHARLDTQVPQRWYRHPECYPLFAISISAGGLGLLLLGKRVFTPLMVFLITYIITYYAFILDTGPYVMFVIPAFYLVAIIIAGMLDGKRFWSWFGKAALLLLLAYNVGFQVLNNYKLIQDIPNRRHEDVDQFISQNIPSNAKVCADWVYYYSVLNNGNPLQLMYSFEQTDHHITIYSRDTFDYDYLVVSKRIDTVRHKLVKRYFSEATLEPVAALGQFPDTLDAKRFQSKLNYQSGPYDGVIYRRIR